MSTVRLPVPALFGGVSQQPGSVRHINQVDAADNALFSVIDGASKRPGSRYLATVSGLTALGNYRQHIIDRSQGEQYIVIYGRGGVRVFDLTGREQTVTIAAAAQTYLNQDGTAAAAGASADDLVLCTNADYTIIANRNVPLRTVGSATFTVSSGNVYADFETMIADTPPATGTYARTKNGTGGRPAGYWQYNPGTATFGRLVGPVVSGSWATDATAATVYKHASRNPGKFRIEFGKQFAVTPFTVAGVAGATTITKAAAFTGYTWASGDRINLVNPALFFAGTGFYAISSKTNNNTVVIVTTPVQHAALIAGSGSVAATILTNNFDIPTNFTGASIASMSDVAAEFQAAIRAVTGDSVTLVAWEAITTSSGRFVITGPNDGVGSAVFALKNVPAQSQYKWADQPPFRGSGSNVPQVFQGTGATGGGTLEVLDRWKRVAAPGQLNAQPDATTMPIAMVRVSPASADDVTGAYIAASFTIDLLDWKPRFSGDQTSNPPPSIFVTDKAKELIRLSDVAFFRNRLVLSGDESLVMSQAGDFFNLFIDDSTNIVDSDPIDVALSSSAVTIVDYLVAFRKTLVAFTKAARQFELNSPDALTPNTAAITPSTSYQSINGVRPAAMGYQIFFPSTRKAAAQLYEYYYDDSQLINAAGDVSAHVPDYLPTAIKSVVTSPNNNTVLLIPRDDSQFFIYREFWSGNQKVQSAWGTYSFKDGDRIVDAAALKDDLYTLTESGAGYLLEKLSIPREAADVRTATHYGATIAGLVVGSYTGISNASFRITIDGVTANVTGCNFTAAATIADVATTITSRLVAAFGAGPSCRVVGNRFVFYSGSSGAASAVSNLTAASPSTGTNIATTALLGAPGESFGPDMPNAVHLDRLIEVTGTYNSGTNETTWDYTLADSSLSQIMLGRDFGALTGSKITPTRVDSHSVKALGNLTAGEVYVGRPFTFSVTLSRPYARDQNGAAVLEGRLLLRELIVMHHDTGSYSVTVEQAARATRSTPYNPRRVGVALIGQLPIEADGRTEVPVRGDAGDVTVSIVNDSPQPCSITALEWVGDFDRRSV